MEFVIKLMNSLEKTKGHMMEICFTHVSVLRSRLNIGRLLKGRGRRMVQNQTLLGKTLLCSFIESVL